MTEMTTIMIIGLLLPLLGTMFGSAFVFLMKDEMSVRLQKSLLGFASGVMVAASVWSLLIPAMEMEADSGKWAVVPAAVGFLLGIGFLLLIDELTPHLHIGTDKPEGIRSHLSKTAMLALAVTIHNLPEGMAVGVVFAGAESGAAYISFASALSVSLGIGIQNIPEGAIISMPMRAAGNSRWRSFMLGSLSGVVEPIGAVAVIVSTIIGIIVGCISGYFGGWVDMFLMRVTEIVGAIPFLPFALCLSAILQASDLHENTRIFIIMLILGVLSWTGLAKLIRGQILAEREKEFVTAARAMGVKEKRIAFKHILPNVISVILVSVTLDFAGCMLTESSLSYLGFGVQLPRPTWGNMLDGSRSALVIQSYWWRWVFPALFLSIVVICINIIGDTLRDVLDPKSEVDK